MSLNLESSSIKLKRHTENANYAPTSLLEGEFAINLIDGALYYGPVGGGEPRNTYEFGNVTLSGSLKTTSGSSIVGSFNDPIGAALFLKAPFSESAFELFNPAIRGTGSIQLFSAATSSIGHHLYSPGLSAVNVNTQNLTVTQTASINYLQVTYESRSIIYTSGSTKFGDTSDDTHQRTGSMFISGNVQVSGSIEADSFIGIEQTKFQTGSSALTDLIQLKVFNFDSNVFVSVDSASGQLTLQFGESNLPTVDITNPGGSNQKFVIDRFTEQSCSFKLYSDWDFANGVSYISHSFIDENGNVLHTTGSEDFPLYLPGQFGFPQLDRISILSVGNSTDNAGNSIGNLVHLTTGSHGFTASLHVEDSTGTRQNIEDRLSLTISKDNPVNNISISGSEIADFSIENAPNDASYIDFTSTLVRMEQGLSCSISIVTNSIATPNDGWVALDPSPSSSIVRYFNNVGTQQPENLNSNTLFTVLQAITNPGGADYHFSTSSAITDDVNHVTASVQYTASYTSSNSPQRSVEGNIVSANAPGGTPNDATVTDTLTFYPIRSIRTFCSATASFNAAQLYNINEWTSSNSVANFSCSIHFLTTSIDGFSYQNEIPNVEDIYPDGLYQWIIYGGENSVVQTITEGGFDVTDNYNFGSISAGPTNYKYIRKKVQDGEKSTAIVLSTS